MSLGPAEILVILVLALLVFGPARLPEVSRQVGGALRELRRVQNSVKREIDTALSAETAPSTSPVPKPAAAPRPAIDEPDHEDAPPPEVPPEPVDRGFEGPAGSFL
jgi:sec-independent protein translocase protein TatA